MQVNIFECCCRCWNLNVIAGNAKASSVLVLMFVWYNSFAHWADHSLQEPLTYASSVVDVSAGQNFQWWGQIFLTDSTFVSWLWRNTLNSCLSRPCFIALALFLSLRMASNFGECPNGQKKCPTEHSKWSQCGHEIGHLLSRCLLLQNSQLTSRLLYILDSSHQQSTIEIRSKCISAWHGMAIQCESYFMGVRPS